MPRVFAYCRVSTTDQTTQNQSIEIKAAGFAIEMQRLIEESISGSVAAVQGRSTLHRTGHAAGTVY